MPPVHQPWGMLVMTWNLQGRVGNWQEREKAIRAHMELIDPDVMMLQESWVENGGPTQAGVLAEMLDRHCVSAERLAGFDRYPAAPYWVVNAIISRWPVELVDAIPLPDEHGVPTWRHVAIAEILRPISLGGPFRVAGTHLEHGLHRSATRDAQCRALATVLADAAGPADHRRELPPLVLGGDLNAVPWSDEIRTLTGASTPAVEGFVFVDAWDAAGNESRGDTWSASNPRVPSRAVHPNRRLDYVMISWPRAKGMGHVESCFLAGTEPINGVWATDHFAVCAEVDL
jgi:endonuclease/exonuclease/phosphatase family metal-dependent hydrolase